MKKVFTLFAAVMMIASVSFAQASKTTEKSHRNLLQATRFAPAKLVKNVATKNGLKVSGNPIWGNTMSYCLDAEYYSCVGTSTVGDTVYWAIQIESAALAGRNNLTDVEFFVAYAGNYTLQIFSGVQPTGTPLFNQTIVATAADSMEWKTVHFTSPIAINQTQDLWIVLSNTDLDYPAAGVTGNEYDNGKWISLDGEDWMLISDADLDYTWMIRAISDTYTVLPPVLDLHGPTAVRTGDTAFYYATSGNADSFEWTITADYLDTTISNVAAVMWETTGTQQVIVTATNTAGSVTDTIDVDVFSCDDITLPYAPVFGESLGCWDNRSDSTESGWFTSLEVGLDEGQVVSLSARNYGIWTIDFPVDNWLFSPEMELPVSGEYEIAWQVKPYEPTYDGDHYGVYIINDGDTTLLFEESLTGMTDYTQRMTVIPSTISGDFKVAFRHFNCDGGYVIILDSIEVRGLTAPYLTLVGPIAAENGTVATFTAIAPNASNFEWAINGTPVDATGNVLTNTFTTNGYHTVAVTATNSVGSTIDSISVEIYSCDAAIESFPYTQNFETGLRCWTMVSADSANDDLFGVYADEDAYDGLYDFRFSSYYSASDYNQFLISPELTLPTTGEYMLKFQYKGESTSDVFRVLASTTTNDTAAFTTVLGNFDTVATNWTEVAFVLPAGTKYVAINYYANYKWYLYVDAMSVEALTAPTVILVGPDTAELGDDVTFYATSTLATSFSWEVDGTPLNTLGNTMTTSFTTTGTHTVTVTATNSVGSNSVSTTIEITECEHITNFPYIMDFETPNVFDCWKFIDADGDGYNWNTNYLRDFVNDSTGLPDPQGHNGSNGMVGSASWVQAPLTPDNWMILPAIDLPANGQYILSWFEKGQDADYATEHYSVYVSTTGRNVNDFTTAAYSGNSTPVWTGRNVNLSAYAGQTIYVAFRHHNVTDMFYLDIDDIKIATEGVGIDEVESSMLSLYPNPASSTVAVSAEGIDGNVTVQIVDMNGRVMMQQNGNAQSFRFDVSSLAQGAYFVRMTGENVNAVRKLIVK